jgi:mobilome CxxCx(11)CxxC protein
MPRTPQTDQICKEAWDRALYAYGTAKIFLERSRRYRRKIRWLAFIGIAGPVLIGVMVLHGVSPEHLVTFIAAVAAISVVEALISVWSIVANWADNLSYSQRSAADNFALSSAFQELGQKCENPQDDLIVKFTALRSSDDARRAQDADQGITEKELRYGHRAGLRQFQRACEGCKKVPMSMDSTDCGVCGEIGFFN